MYDEKLEFNEEYASSLRLYPLSNLIHEPPETVLDVGEAGRLLRLSWHPPDSLAKSDLLSHALAFQVRKDDMFKRITNEYQYYLAKIYESFLSDKFGISEISRISMDDYSAIGIELTLVIHHTYGHEKITKKYAIGILNTYDIDDLFWPYGDIKGGKGDVDRYIYNVKGDTIIDLTKKR